MGGCFEAEYDQHPSDDETGHGFSQSTAHTTLGVPPGKAVDYVSDHYGMQKSTRNYLYECAKRKILHTVQREIFAGAKFREIASYCLEKIFMDFNFRAFFTWRPYLH
jgi:hypothetical protein